MPTFDNHFLHRVRADAPAMGFGLSFLRNPALLPVIRSLGYDWLAIDLEHGSLTLSEAAQLCAVGSALGIAPFVRVHAGALDEGARLLDGGAQGVIVPRVETRALAEQMVETLRYAPAGRRGWGGSFAQMQAGPVSAATQVAEARTVLLPMIESAKGVAHVSDILACEGIDGVLVGLADLSLDLGTEGAQDHPDVTEALGEIAAACTRHGKLLVIGGARDGETVRLARGLGACGFALGSDASFLLSAATESLAATHKMLEQQQSER